MPNYLQFTNGIYHYYRRVPSEFADVEPRRFVKQSLKTDSREIARRRADIVNNATEEYWRSLLLIGESKTARERYEAAVSLAKSLGHSYAPMAELAAGDLAELVKRYTAAAEHLENPSTTAAILGGVTKPPLTISEALAVFYSHTRDEVRHKTERELRRWKNPREKAIRNFIAQHGDIAIETVTRSMALEFRDWWVERVMDSGLTANAANKDIGVMSRLFRTVSDAQRLNLSNPFEGLRLSEAADQSTKTSFETDYVREILTGEKLKGLNQELRMVLFAMADTGAGFNELTGLDPDDGDIRLDTTIPHIRIRANKHREIKTVYRPREIPLVGAALHAFKAMPKGFETYRGKPDSASTTANKFLRENGLCPSEDHSANSFRHSFEDRLTAIDPPDKIIASLMGHKFTRERYGKGPDLDQKLAWMKRIELSV